jgi:putative ABC transport system permease protein
MTTVFSSIKDFNSKFFKICYRYLVKNKLYTLINVIGLSSALTAVILISIFLIHEFGSDRQYLNYENLYRLNRGDNVGLAIPLKDYLIAEFQEFDEICRLQPMYSPILKIDKNNIRIDNAYFADTTAFKMFDIEILMGVEEDFILPQTIFLSESTAKLLFGNTNPIGKRIKYEGKDELIVKGIYKDLPLNSHLKFDFLVSINLMPKMGENHKYQYEEFEQWGCAYYVIYKNKSGLHALDNKLNQFIKTQTKNDNWQMHIQSFSEIYFDNKNVNDDCKHGNKSQLLVLFLVAFGIIVLASINYFNLSTATSFSRSKEIAVKKTFGVSRKVIFSQFIFETLLIVIISVIIGFLLAETIMPYLNNLYSLNLEVNLLYNSRYIVWVLFFVIFLGVAAGFYPALILSGLNVQNIFHKTDTKGKDAKLARSFFIVFQYSITVILFLSVFTINRQIQYLINLDPGFNKDQLVYLSYGEEVSESFEGFRNELLQYSSIIGITQTANIPGQIYWENLVDLNGERLIFYDCIVDPNFADVMGLKMVEGNFINESDPLNQTLVLNESAVKFLNLKDPIGYNKIWGIPVVGVIQDFNYQSMHSEIKPMMIRYVPYFSFATIKLQSGEIQESIKIINELWDKYFPDHMIEYHFFDQEFKKLYKSEMQFGKMISAFSILAILISCIGLFGLTSFFAEKYKKDSGIKIVFGATKNHLLKSYIFKFIKWQIIGIVFGLISSKFILDIWLNRFAYKTSIPITGVFISIIVILGISFITVLYQSLKLSRQNPVDILRDE